MHFYKFVSKESIKNTCRSIGAVSETVMYNKVDAQPDTVEKRDNELCIKPRFITILAQFWVFLCIYE